MPPTMPSECTAIVATMIFVLWVVIAGALVSQRPELYRPWIIHSVSYGLLAIPLAVLIARDVYPRVRQWLRPKHQPSAGSSYSKNLSSTIMTICITMIIVPPLYCKLWHPGRIRTKIVFDEDTVVSCSSPPNFCSGMLTCLCLRTGHTSRHSRYFKKPTGRLKPT